MKRLLLLAAVLAAGVLSLAATSAAWGADTITPMCTTAQGTQQCGGGWYGTPVQTLTWNWTSGGTPSNCQEGSYQRDSVASVSCTVNWGQFGYTAYYTVQVETSTPTATAAPSRRPNPAGWYNHPVTATFAAHSFSGIASCAPTTYAGPSSRAATVSATCVDNAGKSVTATSAPFAYDATPPALTVTASTGDTRIALSWQSSGDIAPIASVTVTRTSTAGRAVTATIYRGDASRDVDNHVRNGVRYRYKITVRDQAGNVSVRTIVAVPGPRLLAPAGNTRLTAPPMLSWTPVRGATYYNVQLYRHGKVLSLWPTHAGLQLRRTWKFDGRRYHLNAGRYRWFVWPGFGRRSAARYGGVIGRGMFIVVR